MNPDGSRPGSGPPTVEVPAGYRIGDWEIVRAVASGAWSSVYAARHLGPATAGLPAEAALKILPTGTSTRRVVHHLEEMVARESRRHSEVHHERLVHTYAVLTVDDPAHPTLDGSAVLVMELAPRSLADLLAEAPGRPLPDARDRLAEIAEGVRAMHAEGWVHGDLKPSNVLVRTDGTCCLADFGLAGALDGTHAYVPPLATPDFTAPERRSAVATAQGQQIRPSDDVWAFGVIACLALTGTMPFPGATPWERAHALEDHVAGRRPLLLPDDLEPWCRDLVIACLALSPQDRPTATALVESLTGAGSPVRTPRRRWGGRRIAVLAAAVTVLTAGAGTTWSLLPSRTAAATLSTSPSRTAAAHSAPDVPEGQCVRAVKDQKDHVTGVLWHQVWYCHDTSGAPQYAAPDGRQEVGWMETTTSWFLCYRHGLRGPDGSDVWYYTQGDYAAAGWRSRLAWGYTPARYVHAPADRPYAGIPACPAGT